MRIRIKVKLSNNTRNINSPFKWQSSKLKLHLINHACAIRDIIEHNRISIIARLQKITGTRFKEQRKGACISVIQWIPECGYNPCSSQKYLESKVRFSNFSRDGIMYNE